MKSRLIVNPVSGTDSASDYLTLINDHLRQRVGAMDIVITVAAGDAARAASDAARDGYDHLFVAGGDGTLNEALNGLGATPGGFEAVTLGVIPLGTGNDFAAALGLPPDPADAVEALLDAVPAAVDVGQLNDRYFVNVSAGGFIAEVSDAVDPRLKTIAGKIAYLLGAAPILFTHTPVEAQIETSAGHATRATLSIFAVCNSRLIGGGRLIAPHAAIDDGLLDVCLIEAMPTVDFLALLTRVSGGQHVDDERVTYFHAPDVRFKLDRDVKVNTDGEVLEAASCEYRVLPGALRVLRPAVA